MKEDGSIPLGKVADPKGFISDGAVNVYGSVSLITREYLEQCRRIIGKVLCS